MHIIAWLVLGLIAGFIASKIVNRQGNQGLLMNSVIGVGGAEVGGWLTGGLFLRQTYGPRCRWTRATLVPRPCAARGSTQAEIGVG